MVKILKYPDPVLREEARNISPYDIDNDFLQKVASMFELMKSSNGAGIAANQIGDTRRFFLLGIPEVIQKKGKKETKVNQFELCINPEILEESIEDIAMTEGCLSLPRIGDIPIYRPQRIFVRYQTIELKSIEVELDGWVSRVFQHELDHLNGKLFIDRLTHDQRISILPQLLKLKREWKESLEES